MFCLSVPAPSRTYTVHAGRGLLDRVGELTKELPKASTSMIVADSNVAPLYADRLRRSLEASGQRGEVAVFPAGEASKCLGTLGELLNRMADSHLSRSDRVYALGGGVTGDLAGLAAALYMRGIGLVQIPTSLLAAVDSSVGGKTAVDLPAGKNLVGSFYQPEMVVCDTDCLATLPDEQVANGFGEVVKTGILAGEPLFSMAAGPVASDALEGVIRRCIEFKRDVVEKDEKEGGLRQILNFGHTFGHAVEKCSGFELPHGFCVGIGMVLVTAACAARGTCPRQLLTDLCGALRAHGLPISTTFGVDELYAALLSDKKRSGSSMTLVLPRGLGDVERRKIPIDEVRALLEEALEASRELPGARE